MCSKNLRAHSGSERSCKCSSTPKRHLFLASNTNAQQPNYPERSCCLMCPRLVLRTCWPTLHPQGQESTSHVVGQTPRLRTVFDRSAEAVRQAHRGGLKDMVKVFKKRSKQQEGTQKLLPMCFFVVALRLMTSAEHKQTNKQAHKQHAKPTKPNQT